MQEDSVTGEMVNRGFIDQNGLFQQAGPAGQAVNSCVQTIQLFINVETVPATAAALVKVLKLVLGQNVAITQGEMDLAVVAMGGANGDIDPADPAAASSVCALVASAPLSVFNGWNSSGGFSNSPADALGGGVNGLGPRGYGSPHFGVDGANGQMVGVSDAGTFVLSETALTMHCWGQNPVVTAKLQLNGQDRFSEREGTYFDLVQPFQHHTRNPDTGINLYSFALRPEEHQPSGTCNFSRIDNATLQLVLSNATVEGTKTAKVRVYATNYNVLRVMSGMGGLAYSN